MKRAFTLIELLVVIAIIAILAAILFPVFAQAKVAAKKAQSISNVKQLTTSAMIYLADVDDIMPITRAIDPATGLNYDRGIVWSSDETVTTPSPVTRSIYANALNPYVKNRDIWRSPVGTDYMLFAGETEAQLGTQRFGYVMNGYMNVYNATGIAQPARTILFQELSKDRQTRKWITVFPTAYCGTGTSGTFETTVPWQFQKDANSVSVFTFQMDKTWFNYGQVQTVSYADGHAKALPARGRDSAWKVTDANGIPYPTAWNLAGINLETTSIGGFWFRPHGLADKS